MIFGLIGISLIASSYGILNTPLEKHVFKYHLLSVPFLVIHSLLVADPMYFCLGMVILLILPRKLWVRK